MLNRAITALFALAFVSTAAHAQLRSKPPSGAQISLCYALGPDAEGYYECQVHQAVHTAQVCRFMPEIQIDDAYVKELARHGEPPIGHVDNLVGAIGRLCEMGAHVRGDLDGLTVNSAKVQARMPQLHVKLIAPPPADENGDRLVTLSLEHGVLTIGDFYEAPSPARAGRYAGLADRLAPLLESAPEVSLSEVKLPAPVDPKDVAKYLTPLKSSVRSISACVESGNVCTPTRSCCSGTSCPAAPRNSRELMRCP